MTRPARSPAQSTAWPDPGADASLFAAVFRAADDALAVLDDARRLVAVNPACCALLGLPESDLLGQQLDWYVDPDAMPGLEPAWRSLLAIGHLRRELPIRRPNGRVLTVEIQATARIRAGRHLVRLLDVTDRKEAAAALAGREATLAAIFAASPDILTILDAAGHVTMVSAAVEQLLGYTAGELQGRPWATLVHPDDAESFAAMLASALRVGQARARYRARDVGGTWRVLEGRARAVGAPLANGALVVIARDVRDQVALEEALERARDAAERANVAKTDFLSRVSHEQRTPLNAILGFAQLLERESLPAGQRESVDYILRAGRHLLQLMDEMLDISRIEAGQLHLRVDAVAVDEVVEEALALVRGAAAAAQVDLAAGPPPGRGPAAQADRRRLQQVLLNLLSNAVKYNRRGGQVRVTYEHPTPDRVRVAIRDTGRGLTPAQLARLFTPFERLGAESSGVEGAGLGLAVAKRLTEAMGGTIGVASTPGQGSTFWVDLPVAPAPARAPAGLLTAPRAALSGPARHVLYVEDDNSNRALVRRMLRARPDVRLHTTRRGRTGLARARAEHPDLILLDLALPDVAGLTVLQRLRADPATAGIPVVVLSADATPGTIGALRAAGADAYLTKPVLLPDLLRVLAATLGARPGE